MTAKPKPRRKRRTVKRRKARPKALPGLKPIKRSGADSNWEF